LNINNLIQILISIFRNIKKFIRVYYVFGIVFFIVAGLRIELTYGDTSTRLGPNVRELAGKDDHPNYKFQYFFLRNLNQNATNDVELAGIVTEVVDGDTLDINGTRNRLALVDTPERGQSGFDKAKKFIESLCLGKKGELDVDNGQRRGDRYGREIGVVYCEGINVNEKLMDNRLARILTEFCDISEFSNDSWVASSC